MQFPAGHPARPAGFGPPGFGIMEGCGMTPASRSALCQTPPRARSTVLSIAAARPHVNQGSISSTK
jgi:hypothetical protein